METEDYQGFTITSEPGHPTDGGRFGAHWFHVDQADRGIFELEMRVTRQFGLGMRHLDLMLLAAEQGRAWVHGLIDLGRFEQGKVYHELRKGDWNPCFAEGGITDNELRFALLGALRRMNIAQQSVSGLLSLDVGGVAAVLGIAIDRAKGALSELLLEELAEPYVETFGHVAADGACRITGEGLRELRRMEREDAERKPVVMKAPRPQGAEVDVFIAYSHKDQRLRHNLETHLNLLKREGTIKTWHDRKIVPGEEWESEIDSHMDKAGIIALLVSADFIASDYCYGIEMRRAMERYEAGEARVIPIILRPCDWEPAPFAKLQALPTDAKPVTSWTNRDQAFADIARRIRLAAEEIKHDSRNHIN